MLVQICVQLFLAFFTITSFPVLYFSVKNKSPENIGRFLIYSAASLIYIVALIACAFGLRLYLDFSWLLLMFLLVPAGVIMHIITLIINVVKARKLQATNVPQKSTQKARKKTAAESTKTDVARAAHKSRWQQIALLVAVILPGILLICGTTRDLYRISSADLLLFFEARGNGGIGDTSYFAYAVTPNSCRSFSIGVNSGGYGLLDVLPAGTQMFSSNDTIMGSYEFNYDSSEDVFTVTYDGEQVCSRHAYPGLINVSLDRAYLLP